MSEMKGRVAIVCGAARGIGKATAERLASEGVQLVLNDAGTNADGQGQDPRVIDEVGQSLRERGARVVTDSRLVGSPGTASEVIELALQSYGRLDSLVFSAGFAAEATVLQTDDALWARVLDTHLTAPFALCRAAGRTMVDAKQGGSIVLVSGPSAFFGARGQAALGAAHAGLIALARSAALELRRHQIRVNAVLPTARTRLTETLPTFASIKADSMSPQHVAAMISFLCSDHAAGVHGEAVGIAGSRAYVVRTKESNGEFSIEADITSEQIAARWDEIVRL